MQIQTKGKLSIIALALLFLTPVIVAIVMNSKLIDFSPESFKNHGNFIKPPIKITDDGYLKDFEGFWTVVYHHSGKCQENCNKMLDTLYRIRLTKGHKMKKIKLLVLYPENNKLTIPQQYTSIQKKAYKNTDNIAKTLSQLSSQSFGQNRGLYLLAPEGYLMMSYPTGFRPQDVIKDLGLVLRARKNDG
jgi:hypothetical protein